MQKHFTELMQIANGRSGYQVSEKAIEFFLSKLKPEGEPLDVQTLHQVAQDFAVLRLPVGSASQDAAVAAIAALTIKHPILREVGLRALESLVDPVTSPVAKHYHEEVLSYCKREAIEIRATTNRSCC